MIIDVSKFDEVSLPFEFTVQPDEIDLDVVNLRLTGPALVSGEATRHIGRVAVEGSIHAEAEFDCTRCLQPINRPLVVEFNVDYLTEGKLATEGDIELQQKDLDTDELDGNQLDLKELVREQILLNIPDQVFCSEDCKGLCVKCGANRNLVDCKCTEAETDPRWDALKNLKDSLN